MSILYALLFVPVLTDIEEFHIKEDYALVSYATAAHRPYAGGYGLGVAAGR